MKSIKVLNFLVVTNIFLLFPSYLSSAEKVQSISTKTAVIFNTLCAKCHEGECSGRLSFDSDSQAASNHIKRYAEEKNLSKGETKEFFTLLEHMKKECALWMPDNGRQKAENFSSENLLHFALPSQHGYFIPLGMLKYGKYRLYIETKEDIHFRIEVISSHFDPFLDRSILSWGKDQRLLFNIDASVTAFLRIRSRKPLHITVLKIEKEDK
jgi:hypothetical protein